MKTEYEKFILRLNRKGYNVSYTTEVVIKDAWNSVVRKCERIAIESSDFLRNVKKLKVK